MQQTLIILKPDAVGRGLVGTIISRLEAKGLQIVAMKLTRLTPALAADHYAVHQARPFYPSLVKFMTSGSVVLLVLQGNNAIDVSRKLMGATFGFKAEPGTIRGDFGLSSSFNLIHGSDSPEAAAAEIKRFFTPGEIQEYAPASAAWVYDMDSGTPQ